MRSPRTEGWPRVSDSLVRRVMRVIVLVTGVLALASPVAGQVAPVDEVKAAFLLNFPKFVAWPAADLTTPLTLGVMGNDALAATLRKIARGKTIEGRPLVVRLVTIKDSLIDLQVLFVGSDEEPRLGAVLERLTRENVLTVSDISGFCARGGMIQFTVADDRVRFDVNLHPVEQTHLTLSSKLLSLARVVLSPKRPGVLP